MRKQFPALIGDGFDDTTLNMWTRIIVVQDDLILFSRSFYLDCSMEAIKLSQIHVAVDNELPLAVFVRNLPLLSLIIVIPPITNPI